MTKRKSRRKITPDPNGTYSPRCSAEEKAASHRKASAKYYARHPHIRERRRIQVAEKSAEKKAKKRRWDPPKRPKAVSTLVGSSSNASGIERAAEVGARNDQPLDSQIHDEPQASVTQGAAAPEGASHTGTTPSHEPSFWDPRSRSFLNIQFSPREVSEKGDAGTAASPNSDERIASQALAALATGVPQAHLSESSLELGVQLTPARSSPAASPSRAVRNFSTGIDCLSAAQMALMHVAHRNSGPLTPPTEEDAARWRLHPYLGGGGVDRDRHSLINAWRLIVCKAHRRARLNGDEVRDGVVMGE
ncbi:hypothetical protein B0H11DRAFT_1921401 [Mycena galericulata]|nr:hypothetical protein B0H11DRAFT_1921401 [Mycena galericulata]